MNGNKITIKEKYIRMNKIGIILIIAILIVKGFAVQAQETLTLEDAMQIALQNSPDIKKSRLEMNRNRLLLDAQLAKLKTHFNLSVTPLSYGLEDKYYEQTSEWLETENLNSEGGLVISQPIKWTDGTLSLNNNFSYRNNESENPSFIIGDSSRANPSTKYEGFNNNLYLNYNQPLFTYNKTKMSLRKQELALENSTLSYSIQMLSIEHRVAQAFYAIYQKQVAQQIAEEEYENQKMSLSIIESKVAAGLLAQEELLQAKVNYATSQSKNDNSKVDLENAKDQFKKLIGLSLYKEIQISTDIKYVPVIVDQKKAIENGLTQRLELSQRKIALNNAEFDLIETSAINEFRGDVDLSLGIMGQNNDLGMIYDRPTKSPRVEVKFTIPLFDWGERKARIKAAQLSVESRELDMKILEDDIIIGIRKICRNLRNLTNQIAIAEQNQKNAQATYEINLEKYKNGDLTSIDLDRYQTQLSQKKSNLADALIRYKLELLNLKTQSLWDFENNTSFVPKEYQQNVKSTKQ